MLRDITTKKPIHIGDQVTTGKGEVAEVTDMDGGRVYIMNDCGIPTQPYGVFANVVNAEWFDIDKRTLEIHEWMKNLPDEKKKVYAINWKMPHTLFNITCKFKNPDDIQGIDWYYIYKSNDLGRWSHGGKVRVQSFS